MSRRKKNLRAFLHQTPNPTIEQAWEAAWEGGQKHYHSKGMQQLEAENDAWADKWMQERKENAELLKAINDAHKLWRTGGNMVGVMNKLITTAKKSQDG